MLQGKTTSCMTARRRNRGLRQAGWKQANPHGNNKSTAHEVIMIKQITAPVIFL